MNIELRSPDKVMKLSRLGSFHQSRLSFLRSFLKEFKDWEYRRDLFDLNKDGKRLFEESIENLVPEEKVAQNPLEQVLDAL